MLYRIIKHEWLASLAERSFLFLAIAFAALLAYGIYNGASWVQMRSAQSQALIEAEAKTLAENKQKILNGYAPPADEPFAAMPDDSYALGMSLQYAVLPFAPLAVTSLGQADIFTLDAGVTISTLQRTKADKSGLENPLSFLSGRFDLSFVVVYLLPLFVLAVSFNLLSGERETGTLALVLSQPVKLKNLLLGKILAQYVLILAITFGITSIGLLLVGVQINSETAPRFLLWAAVVAAYAAFWFAVAALVNAFGKSSSANAVACSAVWLVLVLILPSLLNVAVSAIYPVPSRTELIAAIRSVNLDMRKDGSRILSEHYQDHPELMPKDGKVDFKDFGLAFVFVQQKQKEKVREVEERFAAQIARQQNLISYFQFLSPSVVAQESFNDIAGTGLNRYQKFQTQTKIYDRAWTEFFAPRIYRTEKLSLADYEQIPRFQFQEESFGVIFGRVAFGVLFLLAASVLLGALAIARFNHFRFA